MNIKKRLKTRIDYQMRTFGICAILIAVFTTIVISPRIDTLNQENTQIKAQIDEQENLYNKLKNEFNDYVNQVTLMLED